MVLACRQVRASTSQARDEASQRLLCQNLRHSGVWPHCAELCLLLLLCHLLHVLLGVMLSLQLCLLLCIRRWLVRCLCRGWLLSLKRMLQGLRLRQLRVLLLRLWLYLLWRWLYLLRRWLCLL